MNINFENFMHYSKKLNILFVEDNEISREITLELLEKYFDNIFIAHNGKDALSIYNKNEIHIILTDIGMPVMGGQELIKKVRSKNKEIPIVVLSAHSESEYFIECIKNGVNGYILKPIDFKQMKISLYNVVEKITLKKEVEDQKIKLAEINTDLEAQMIQKIAEVYNLNEEILETQREIVFTMGAIGESRSKETGNHVKRVALYSELLGRYSGLSEEKTQLLKEASPMHDIGKVAIPDNILKKEGPLTDEEREIMNTHASLGYDMLKHSKRELLKIAAAISKEHHERYDGLGYPDGLKGEEISIYGRITAVADVFDALGSDRCYKKAWKDEKIEALLTNGKGKHFDPNLVDIFFEHKEKFHHIRDTYKDV